MAQSDQEVQRGVPVTEVGAAISTSGALIDDWYAHSLYGTVFLYGYLIARGFKVLLT